MIRHVVMWTLRPGTEAEAAAFVAGMKALEGVVPGLLHMQAGLDCGGGQNYDLCIIADFPDWEALAQYQCHPAHETLSDLCSSIRINRVAVDLEL